MTVQSLSIKLRPHHEADRVPVRVRRLSDLEGRTVQDWSIDVRLSERRGKKLRVDPGHYLVESFWRHGRLTTNHCVVKDGEAAAVVLERPSAPRGEKSPHRDFTQPSAGGMFRPGSHPPGDGPAIGLFRSERSRSTWALLQDRGMIETATQISADGRPLHRTDDMPLVGNGGIGCRDWVAYWASDSWAVSSIPSAGDSEVPALLRSNPAEQPFVAVSDPDVVVMTDLLPAGNSEAACRYSSATFADLKRRDLAFMVASRPLGVCAFAYGVYQADEEHGWITALEGMVTEQAWLPDVAAILGWRTLMAVGDRGGKWELAGGLFERAIEAGVPYYSLGVRLLAEGLTMIAAGLPEHADSAALARSFAARIVPTEAFTTVRL